MSGDNKRDLAHKVADLSTIPEVDWEKLSKEDLHKLIERLTDPKEFIANFASKRLEQRFEKRMEQVSEVGDRLRRRIRERPFLGAVLEYLSEPSGEEKKDDTQES
jgi:hypothetical protein